MNNDRFLTRVFDKQEKKMLNQGIDYYSLDNRSFLVDNCSSIITKMFFHNATGAVYTDSGLYVPFGDRFIPMQCWGLPDKNKKLIYDDDIIKFQGQLYRALFNGYALGFSSIKEACNVLVPTSLTRNNSEIIGSYWENPELMEKNNG